MLIDKQTEGHTTDDSCILYHPHWELVAGIYAGVVGGFKEDVLPEYTIDDDELFKRFSDEVKSALPGCCIVNDHGHSCLTLEEFIQCIIMPA